MAGSNVVKDVIAVVTIKAKFRLILIQDDYDTSDGTDAGAVKSCLLDEGFTDWDEAEIDTVVSIAQP